MPLNEEEQFLVIEQIEKMGLNIKYKELEQIKIFLRDGWSKMVYVFAENDYDRNPDKLAKSYFHMENQAKMHMERYYIHKKLPMPRKIDYMFVKLCQGDFESLGLDMKAVQEDSKIFDQGSPEQKALDNDETPLEETGLLTNDSIEENDHILPKPSTSQKRAHSEETDSPPNKFNKIDEEVETKSLQIKLLLAEDKRKEKEHNLIIKQKY